MAILKITVTSCRPSSAEMPKRSRWLKAPQYSLRLKYQHQWFLFHHNYTELLKYIFHMLCIKVLPVEALLIQKWQILILVNNTKEVKTPSENVTTQNIFFIAILKLGMSWQSSSTYSEAQQPKSSMESEQELSSTLRKQLHVFSFEIATTFILNLCMALGTSPNFKEKKLVTLIEKKKSHYLWTGLEAFGMLSSGLHTFLEESIPLDKYWCETAPHPLLWHTWNSR